MGKIRNVLRKVLAVYRSNGLKGIFNRIDSTCSKIDVWGFYGYTVDQNLIELNVDEKKQLGGQETVNWIIPDLNVGSGGHMNIFRFVTQLEGMGLHNRIYLFGSNRFKDDNEFRLFLKRHYNSTLSNPDVEVYNSTDHISYAQATIATGWQTAYFVRRFNNTDVKYYFVQDFEPYFYPMGSEYLLAENTYKFGFKGITAGNWLKEKLHDEYGMDTESFAFSYDKNLYCCKEKRDSVKRVFFYARPVTPRRAFEIGLLALIELYKRLPEIEVIFAGWDVSNYEIPFIHLNAGSVPLEELSDLYAQCDMCLVMSTTNLSLLPLEIMASNSVVVCTKGRNNEWLLNDDNAILVSYEPIEIANVLEYHLLHRNELKSKRKNGLEYAQTTDWGKEAQKVYETILKGIRQYE